MFFQKGDIVVCIDQGDKFLTNRKVYLVIDTRKKGVEGAGESTIKVKNDNGDRLLYFQERFLLVKGTPRRNKGKFFKNEAPRYVGSMRALQDPEGLLKKKQKIVAVAPIVHSYNEHEKLWEATQEKLRKGGDRVNICAWAMTYDSKTHKVFPDEICHASLRHLHNNTPHDEVTSCILYYSRFIKGEPASKERTSYHAFADWALNRSPWAHVFITKDASFACENYVAVDVNCPGDEVVSAAVLLRTMTEYPEGLKVFMKAKEAGLSEWLSYILSQCFSPNYQLAMLGGNHKVLNQHIGVKNLVSAETRPLHCAGWKGPFKEKTDRNYSLACTVDPDMTSAYDRNTLGKKTLGDMLEEFFPNKLGFMQKPKAQHNKEGMLAFANALQAL